MGEYRGATGHPPLFSFRAFSREVSRWGAGLPESAALWTIRRSAVRVAHHGAPDTAVTDKQRDIRPDATSLELRGLRPVLAMILNALDRDAAEGKAARGEMAEELRAKLATLSAKNEGGKA